jgi:hypothetical protein
LFNRKADILNTILIVFLAALAIVQVRGLVLKPGAAPAPGSAVPVQYTVERAPEVRPAAAPPRPPGRSGIRVARAHMLEATN